MLNTHSITNTVITLHIIAEVGWGRGKVVPCSRALCYHSHRFTTFRKCIHKRQVPTEYHQLLNLTTLLSSGQFSSQWVYKTCILHISCCSSLLVLSMFNFQRFGCLCVFFFVLKVAFHVCDFVTRIHYINSNVIQLQSTNLLCWFLCNKTKLHALS